jgi:hypothetical protein
MRLLTPASTSAAEERVLQGALRALLRRKNGGSKRAAVFVAMT